MSRSLDQLLSHSDQIQFTHQPQQSKSCGSAIAEAVGKTVNGKLSAGDTVTKLQPFIDEDGKPKFVVAVIHTLKTISTLKTKKTISALCLSPDPADGEVS